MDTHPEEFYQERKSGVKFNWSHQIKDNKKFMTEDEYKAVWGKYSEINLERAMQDVTERLLSPEPNEVELHGFGFGNAQLKAEGQRIAMSKMQVDMMKQQMEHQRELVKHELDTLKYVTKGRYESSED
jgi:hypothetical protein